MANVQIDTEVLKKLQLYAGRYEFLRDDDNFGNDQGDDCWAALGEARNLEFDAIVDSRMERMLDNDQHFDNAL